METSAIGPSSVHADVSLSVATGQVRTLKRVSYVSSANISIEMYHVPVESLPCGVLCPAALVETNQLPDGGETERKKKRQQMQLLHFWLLNLFKF